MAEELMHRNLGHAHASNDLHYGHLGSATYDEERHEWSFIRRIRDPNADSAQSAFPFQHLEAHSRLLFSGQDEELAEKLQPMYSRSNVKAFLKHVPTVIPGLAYIRSHHLDIPIDGTDVNGHRPHISDRLSFGYAVQIPKDRSSESSRHVLITAFVVGENAEHVKLARVDQESRPDPSGEPTLVHNSGITDSREALWVGSGDPVHQIRFATMVGPPKAWVAFRQRGLITILQPVLHYRPLTERRDIKSLSTSRQVTANLDTNLVVSLPSSRTGNYPFADVDFHPSHQSLFAVIDEHGNWSIWNIHATQPHEARQRIQVDLQQCGKLCALPIKRQLSNRNPYYDGWHRIWQLGGAGIEGSPVLVLDRHRSAVIDPKGGKSTFIDLRLGQSHENQYVLDAVRSELDSKLFFILTSTRLLVFSASKAPESDQRWPSILCSWVHFRNRNDLNMRLSLIESLKSIIVVVHSQTMTLATVFRFALEPRSSTPIQTLADPAVIELYPAGYDSKYGRREGLYFRFIDERYEPQDDKTDGRPFLRLLVQYDSLQIWEHIYSCTDPVLHSHSATPIFPRTCLQPKQNCVSQVSEEKGGNNVNAATVENLLLDDQMRKIRYGSDLPMPITQQREYNRQVLYNSVTGSGYPIFDSGEWLQQLDPNELHTAITDQPTKLLSEICPGTVNVKDVEETALALRIFLRSTLASDTRIDYYQVKLKAQQSAVDLQELYNHMLLTYLARLSSGIPDRIRVNRERLIRNIAAELVLSTVVVHLATAQFIEKVKPEPVEVQLHCPDHVHVRETGSMTAANKGNDISASITRLRTYAPGLHDAPVSSPSSVLQDILFHLPTDISTDPTIYSYQGVEQALARDVAEAQVAALDAKTRKRLERRTQTQQRRLQAQEQRTQQIARQINAVPTVLDSQRPLRSGSSVIALPFREVQSSQPPAPGSSQPGQVSRPFPMSQPEPGVYGARKTQKKSKIKTNKNRRQDGF